MHWRCEDFVDIQDTELIKLPGALKLRAISFGTIILSLIYIPGENRIDACVNRFRITPVPSH